MIEIFIHFSRLMLFDEFDQFGKLVHETPAGHLRNQVPGFFPRELVRDMVSHTVTP